MIRPRFTGLLLGIALLATSAGCGVSDYESRMAQEQARLDHLDRENQLLEAPVKWPERKAEKKDEKTPDTISPADVFFRPPRGINAAVPQPGVGNVQRYAQPQGGAGAFLDVALMVAKGKGKDAFQKEALDEFKIAGQAEKKHLQPPGRKPMTFEQYRVEQAGLVLFLYQEETFQAAVLFRSSKPDPAALDLSLGSLALGARASAQHHQYGRRSQAGK